jgi:hypothetical protein
VWEPISSISNLPVPWIARSNSRSTLLLRLVRWLLPYSTLQRFRIDWPSKGFWKSIGIPWIDSPKLGKCSFTSKDLERFCSYSRLCSKTSKPEKRNCTRWRNELHEIFCECPRAKNNQTRGDTPRTRTAPPSGGDDSSTIISLLPQRHTEVRLQPVYPSRGGSSLTLLWTQGPQGLMQYSAIP